LLADQNFSKPTTEWEDFFKANHMEPPSGFTRSQQPDMVKLKGEAQNAFNVISNDKLKIKTFCEMADLGNQLDRADRANDTNKTEEVSQKLDELERKLPEYSTLVD
jgi:hypothetical protein